MYRHKNKIVTGEAGELSKIDEELSELKDVEQNHPKPYIMRIIECSDIIESVGSYTFRKNKIPLFLVVLICYLRKLYKPIRNVVLDIYGKPKSSFFDN